MKMSVNLLEENLPGLLQPSKYNHLSEDEVSTNGCSLVEHQLQSPAHGGVTGGYLS